MKQAKETRFQVSSLTHASTEQAVIAALPLNVKHGLIQVAKAARIASIARPTEDLTSSYGLQEDIDVDKFITPYKSDETTASTQSIQQQVSLSKARRGSTWTIGIYEKRNLIAKMIDTFYSDVPS